MERKFGTVLSYVNVLVQNGVFLIYTPLLLHFLGSTQFGLFQLTSQTVNALSILSMGFSAAYVKFFWQCKNQGDDSLSNLNGLYLMIFTIISVITILIGVGISLNINLFYSGSFTIEDRKIGKVLTIIMTLNIATGFLSSVFNSYIVANQRFIFQQFRTLIGMLLQPLIVFILLIFGFKVISVGIVQLLISIILLLLNMQFAIQKLNMRFSVSLNQQRIFASLITFSGFIFINQIVDLINNNLPGVIVGKFLKPADVAIYAIAIQLRSLFFQLSLALSGIFIPRINELVSLNGDSDIQTLMTKIGRIQLAVLTLIYGGFLLTGQEFIRLWAGERMELAYYMVVVMVLPALVPLSQTLGIEIQRAKNMHKFRSISLGLLSIGNVIITFLCVQIFGVFGSVFGYVFSLSIGNGLLINVYNHKFVGLNMIVYWKSMTKLLLSFVGAVLVGLIVSRLFSKQTIISAGITGSIYVISYVLLWYRIAANTEEKRQFASLKQKFVGLVRM